MKNLIKVLETLKKGQEQHLDLVINTAEMEFNPGSLIYSDMIMLLDSEAAQKELCNRIGLPYGYYSTLMDDIVDHNEALKYNVSYWMDYSKKQVLIRCLKKKFTDFEAVVSVRGVLSNKYHIINHYDAANELVEQIKRKVSTDIELSRYIQEDDNQRFIFEVDIPGLKTEIGDFTGNENDFGYMGVTMANSELGRAIFELQPYVKLSNGLVVMLNYRETRVHIGTELEPGIYEDGVDAVDFTLSTVNDMVTEILSRLNQGTILNTVKELYDDFKNNVPAKPIEAIESYLKGVGVSESEAVSALEGFLTSKDKSALDAYIATTAAIIAQSNQDYYNKLEKSRILGESFGSKKRGIKY